MQLKYELLETLCFAHYSNIFFLAKMSDIGPHIKNISSKHKRGAPLSKGEKEFVCYIYDQCISKYICIMYNNVFICIHKKWMKESH